MDCAARSSRPTLLWPGSNTTLPISRIFLFCSIFVFLPKPSFVNSFLAPVAKVLGRVKAGLRPFWYALTDVACRALVAIRWHLRQILPGRHHGLPERVVVTLTSYPARYATLALTLKSLLTQSVRPDNVILWIAHDDAHSLPSSVTALRNDGLQIRYCDD